MIEHEAPRPLKVNSTPATVYALLPLSVLLCLQSVLLMALAFDRVNTQVYLAGHFGLSAVVGAFGAWWAGARGEDTFSRAGLVLQLVIWIMLAGPFGTLAAMALFVPKAAGAVDITSDWRQKLTNPERLHTALLDSRLRLEHAHEVRPLLDVVIDGTRLEKLDALSVISQRYVPAFAPALKRALQDGDSSVRVLAATVMAQQNNAYTKRIGEALRLANTEAAAADNWHAVGQAYQDYAESGLLDASRAADEKRRARMHFARSAKPDTELLVANAD